MVKSNVDIPWEELSAPDQSESYLDLQLRPEMLPKGSSTAPGRLILPCDILVEHDVAIQADIYRPPGALDGTTPAILSRSPFGKKINGIQSLKLMTPWNLGIPEGALSGLEKFEGLDPAEFVDRGYAIVNVDSRGAFDSEGRMAIMGTQEAEDGYDVTEWIAKQDWCNGNVGMGGNSHLAIVQWFIAALQPPSLCALGRMWGSLSGTVCKRRHIRGDLFDNLFIKYMLRGRHGMESFRKMFEHHPLANDWWNDKRPGMTKINIPTYITGTYRNTMHGMGAIRGWLEVTLLTNGFAGILIRSGRHELLSFFDRYLKGINNDWESTPRARMSLLRFREKAPIENIVESDFPPSRTDYRKAHLTSAGLTFDKPSGPESAIS
ncbi:hypothetical protein N7486_007620 [Penicillium sp. IBT 16267x]|nr:hypothetical protein N7486_007620 [Penicillium sp. IBT 16267x]